MKITKNNFTKKASTFAYSGFSFFTKDLMLLLGDETHFQISSDVVSI